MPCAQTTMQYENRARRVLLQNFRAQSSWTAAGILHIVVLAVLWSHLLLLLLLWDNGASPGGSNEGNMQGCRGRVQQRSNIVAVY